MKSYLYLSLATATTLALSSCSRDDEPMNTTDPMAPDTTTPASPAPSSPTTMPPSADTPNTPPPGTTTPAPQPPGTTTPPGTASPGAGTPDDVIEVPPE